MLIDSLFSSSQELVPNLQAGFPYGNNNDLCGTELPGLRLCTLADLVDPEFQTGRSHSAPDHAKIDGHGAHLQPRCSRPWAPSSQAQRSGLFALCCAGPRTEDCWGLAVAVHGRRRHYRKERSSTDAAVT
ncbi:hypothetical protein PVAP13_5NG422180 [Panicum virgatum]|uniref:Uncharacterized protein n=1 Tax=Panicum virgatum TaxID=38727 RepID=A0A8T0RXH5_PANVG|nr:hypothetical protein PVAP13_5NG422180 [Panicum virgatum]